MVGEDVELALGLLLPELQPVRTKPMITAPAAKDMRLFTAVTIRLSSGSDKCLWHRRRPVSLPLRTFMMASLP